MTTYFPADDLDVSSALDATMSVSYAAIVTDVYRCLVPADFEDWTDDDQAEYIRDNGTLVDDDRDITSEISCEITVSG